MKKPSRRPETDAAYLREGRRHLARALRRRPEIKEPIEALLTDVATNPGVLTRNSVSLYRQQYAAILSLLCTAREISEERQREYRDDINRALARRKGKPAEPRTSSKKRLDVSKTEARRILKDLAKRALAEGVESPVLVLGLVLFFAPRIGCRPCEWLHAFVEGDELVIRQAKLSDTRAVFPTRRFPLAQMSERQREAIPVLLDLLGQAIAKYGTYHRWHRAAAELLARACSKLDIPRVSLYAFRHIAIGVWAAAGMAPWQIAALAGHASVRTRRRHYNGGASGWEQDATSVPDAERVAALERRAASPETRRRLADDEDSFAFEAPPEFRAASAPVSSAPADWRPHADTIRERGESLLKPWVDPGGAPEPVDDGEPAPTAPPSFGR